MKCTAVRRRSLWFVTVNGALGINPDRRKALKQAELFLTKLQKNK